MHLKQISFYVVYPKNGTSSWEAEALLEWRRGSVGKTPALGPCAHRHALPLVLEGELVPDQIPARLHALKERDIHLEASRGWNVDETGYPKCQVFH